MIQQRHKLDYVSNRIPNLIDNVVSSSFGNIIGIERICKIVTKKVGTFTLGIKGPNGSITNISWGDSYSQNVTLSGNGLVQVTHDYTAGEHKIKISNPLNISWVQLSSPGQDVSSVDFSKLLNCSYIYIYYSRSSGFSSLSSFSNLVNLSTLKLDLNGIVDLSPISNINALVTLSFYSNFVEDISPIINLPNVIDLKAYLNPINYPSPDEGTGISLYWSKKSKGSFDFHGTIKTLRQVDWMLNDLASAGWDNSLGSNTVNLTGTHPVTSLSDVSRSELLSNGVTLNVDIFDFMVVQGDSNSNTNGPNDWPGYMDNATWNAGYVVILAEAGKTAETILAEYASKDALWTAPSGQTGYYFFMAGTNDLVKGRTSTELIADHAAILSAAQVTYGSVCAIHVLPSILITGDAEAARVAVNAAISTSGDVDVVVPVPALLQDPSDTDYYMDGTHLTVLGRQTLASAVETAMGW